MPRFPFTLDDTIAAIATAPGVAGLAVLRVSGTRALAIAEAVFSGRAPLAAATSHTLHHGWALAPAAPAGNGGARARLDEVVAAVFRAPRSYTGEDVIEFSCHGGSQPAARVLEALLAAGARLARPGEFTLRAFLHGRLDLAEAEAVADLIHASTDAAHGMALAQLAGALSRRMKDVRERLTDALAEVEARVDFAEDVGGIEVPPHVVSAIEGVRDELDAMLRGVAWGRAIREGVNVPLVGRPNVGKSSLFNALLGEARAIVADLPGTTRDRVSETLELDGVRVMLSDTAGLRDSPDRIETIGIERTRAALADSPLAVWVLDGSAPLSHEDHAISLALAGKPVLVALNKSDRGTSLAETSALATLDGVPRWAVRVSALRGDGIAEMRAGLLAMLGGGPAGARAEAVTGNPRHAEAMTRAAGALARAGEVAHAGAPGEIVALELCDALSALGEVTGESVGEDLLDRIFSRFCVGK